MRQYQPDCRRSTKQINQQEQRIKRLQDLETLERFESLKQTYIKCNPSYKRFIQEGYVMHPIRLRACDIQKIYENKRDLFQTPKAKFRVKRDKTIIAQSIVNKSFDNYEAQTNYSFIACMPSFYNRQTSMNIIKHKSKDKIRSMSVFRK
ncbi:hypothetical protein pb186bvf_006661 [Paramecium bursaria]